LQSLKVFVEQIDPHNSILPSFNFELWTWSNLKTTSLEEII
jgi:hypothetical protein